MLGQIGGLNDALFLIFEALMGLYTPAMFAMSFLKHFFLVDHSTPGDSQFRHTYAAAPATEAEDKLASLKSALVAKLLSMRSAPKTTELDS